MKTSTRVPVLTAMQFISANKCIGAMQFFADLLNFIKKKREPNESHIYSV